MKVTVTTKEFLEAIKTIEGSLNTNQRNLLSNICIKIKSYYIELVATDSNSLTMVRINPEYNEPWDKELINKEFLYPIEGIKRAVDKTSKIVELEFIFADNDNKVIILSNNGTKTALSMVAGEYPRYENLMPYNDNYNEIKRNEDETIIIGITKKLLLDILKSYDSKNDNILKFEIPKDNNRYISIQPIGINNGKKFTILMPARIR